MLTEEQALFYENQGYLVVDDVLSDFDLDLIKIGITNMLDAIIIRAKNEYPSQQNLFDNADNISSKMNVLESVDHKYI